MKRFCFYCDSFPLATMAILETTKRPPFPTSLPAEQLLGTHLVDIVATIATEGSSWLHGHFWQEGNGNIVDVITENVRSEK